MQAHYYHNQNMRAQYYQFKICRLSITKLRQKGFNYLLPLDKWVSLFPTPHLCPYLVKFFRWFEQNLRKQSNSPTINDHHNAPKPPLLTDMCPSTVWQATSSYSTPWYTPGLTSPTLVKCLFLLSHFFTSRAFYHDIFTIINTLSHVPYGLCTVCIPRCPTGTCSKKMAIFHDFCH